MTGMPKYNQKSKLSRNNSQKQNLFEYNQAQKLLWLSGFQTFVLTILCIFIILNKENKLISLLVIFAALTEGLIFIGFLTTRFFYIVFKNSHIALNFVLFACLSFIYGAFFSPWIYWLLLIPAIALLLGNQKEIIFWGISTVLSLVLIYCLQAFQIFVLETPIQPSVFSERFILTALVIYFILLLALKEFLENQKYHNLHTELKKAVRENTNLKKQFHVLDNRNFRLVKLYQNLKNYERTSEQKTEIITEAAIALSSKNKEIQNVVDRFMTQSKKLEEINEDLTNSIRYAQRIQAAITPDSEMVISKFRDAFIYYQPRDIVSGDFYWYTEKKYLEGVMKILIVADCTGHGVPGAFMTIMGNSLINEIVNEMQVVQPDALLQELDRKIIETLSSRNGQAIHDGMDMVVLMIDDRQKLIHYAAAHNPLYYVRKQKIVQIKGSKFAVGSSQYKTQKIFKMHTIQAEPGDVFYVFSDGFQDQFGEKEKRKYMTRRFRNFLLTINRMPLQMQGNKVKSEFEHWKGNIPQTDDVLVIGFRM